MGSGSIAFKEWAAQQGITQSTAIATLQDTRLGVDADDYLESLLIEGGPGEPLLPAHGGLPFKLYAKVDEDVRNFQEAGIEPLFVFNGLDLACNDRSTFIKEGQRALDTLNEAWRIYDEGRADESVNVFGKACW